METKQEVKKEEKSTIERMKEHYASRLEDVQILLELENIKEEAPLIAEKVRNDYGELNEYGLSCDFADFSTDEGPTEDQQSRFFRFQFSYGGPQEELRIYSNGAFEFWFLDWGVGEHCNGEEFRDFLEYVTGQTVEEIQEKVLNYINTGEEPKI